MKNKNIGERDLIKKIKGKINASSRDVIKGIGDDAAVIRLGNKYLLFTTDMLVEGIHFSFKYSSPKQVGMKAVEQNVSDIAAMGGIPKYAVISVGLPKADERFIDGLYSGIVKKSKKYKIDIVGGNISKSNKTIINVAMVGFSSKFASREKAKHGDLVFCTGHVGGSAAGLGLLKRRLNGRSIKKHLEPKARLDISKKLVKIGVNSMIDISDGIASEILNICEASDAGAEIYYDKIPISKDTIKDAKKLGKNPVELALYGGEDFELLFTASKSRAPMLKKFGSLIGKIVNKKQGIKLIKGNRKLNLKTGFDHFK